MKMKKTGLKVMAAPNKRMHATRDTLLVISSNGLGGRVMRGVRPLSGVTGMWNVCGPDTHARKQLRVM